MKREGSMHLVPAPAVRLMKSRVTSRPGNKVYNLEFSLINLSSSVSFVCKESISSTTNEREKRDVTKEEIAKTLTKNETNVIRPGL